MNHNFFETLACPSSLTGSRCLGTLHLAQAPAPRFDPSDPDEIMEGVLECQACGQSYPVLCGVTVLLPDVNAYLSRHYETIFTLALEHDLGISPAMRNWLHQRGVHAESGPRSGGEDSPRALGSYLRAHYDREASLLAFLPAGHPLQAFAAAYPQADLYRVLIDMLTPCLPPKAHILDIGCHVGRLTRDLAGQGHQLLGLDISFPAVFTARRAVRSWPSRLDGYEYYRDGFQREHRPLDLPPLPNAECLVASATQLPLRPATFKAVACANVIDILPDPIALLREIRTVLQDEGLLALSTPYHRGASRAAARWLGNETRLSAAKALKWRIGHFFKIQNEQDLVPWVLGEHERRFQVYLNHCLVGEKISA
jgi:SAM-dependent methyltransferase/uncharacterized protein YbaR (Trm112 family)